MSDHESEADITLGIGAEEAVMEPVPAYIRPLLPNAPYAEIDPEVEVIEPAPDLPSLGEQLATYLNLHDEVKATEAYLESLKGQRDAAGEVLIGVFERDGVNSLRSTDGRTVYLARELWARAADAEALTKALRANGLGDIVKETVNTQTLTSVVREHDKSGEPLPPEVADAIIVSEVFKPRVRKSS